jgi:type IV pilus assembly protein PilW
LASLQQSVRTAFEYLGNDARMVGHLGCYTGSIGTLPNDMSATSIATNFNVGIEGYEYKNATAGVYTLTADKQTDITTAASWEVNTSTAGINTLPVATLGGALTPGSDILVIRTVVGKPMRLTASTTAAGSTIALESVAGGKCSDGTTDKVSGFCAGSYGLIASCGAARAFRVNTLAGSTLTPVVVAGSSYPVFDSATAEVFPIQTVAYYVKSSSSGTTTSLYRRVFNGDPAAGVEQELVEDVDNLQLRFGRDTTLPDPDGTIDDYVTAQSVGDWSRVVTVRMSVVLRSASPLASDVAGPASAPVNGVAVTYPTGSRYDRRVFTTTVAIRNKIAYFP